MYNKGLYAIEEGKIDEAMAIFQALIVEFPQGRYTSNAKYERARIYRKNGNISKAAQDLKEVIDLPLSRKTVPAMFELAKIYESQKKYSDALGLYMRIIEDHPNSENITVAIHKRNEVNILLLFSKYPAPFSFEYTVNPGDSLYKIAKKFNTTVELLRKKNEIIDDRIFPGQKLKIVKGDFSVLIDKSQKTLYLKLNDEILKTYSIAVGRDGITPIGKFKIINKLENPVWYSNGRAIQPGDPENLLGVRWIGIDSPGYGIHGTTEKIEISLQATSGCVRMTNTDVVELYDLLTVGVPVKIID
ncbi:L,D-transpeptidase family protein [PVC group bacterium]|nr:L,D-transpeptidase family protein [PVC group bacterium]